MIRTKDRDCKRIAKRILGIMQEQRGNRRGEIQREAVQGLTEDSTFYIFRTDNNAVLAKGIQGYEAAKKRATQFRQSMNLRWDQIQLKAERKVPQKFDVSPNGRAFTNARGDTGRVDYANRSNPSKGRRFRGYTDSQGNFHDID